jgi:F-type H+-transporting ATPase subunit a
MSGTLTAVPLNTADISVGDHITRTWFGLTFNVDTMWGTVLAGTIVIVLGLLVARSASSAVPGKLQIFFETLVGQVEDQVGMDLKKRAPFVVPLAITIFIFVLTCNWLAVIPSGHHPEYLPPPTADVNLTYALGLIVSIWSISTGIRLRGVRNYLSHLKEPYVILTPINVLEELIKPFTLALRLFGNIFAGTVMLLIFTLLPAYILWLPNIGWKLFDIFIGLIQAFIFALLTILYFGTAIGEAEAH